MGDKKEWKKKNQYLSNNMIEVNVTTTTRNVTSNGIFQRRREMRKARNLISRRNLLML